TTRIVVFRVVTEEMRQVETDFPVLLVRADNAEGDVPSLMRAIVVECRCNGRLAFEVVPEPNRQLDVEAVHYRVVVESDQAAKAVGGIVETGIALIFVLGGFHQLMGGQFGGNTEAVPGAARAADPDARDLGMQSVAEHVRRKYIGCRA